jgi:hypothetical protein
MDAIEDDIMEHFRRLHPDFPPFKLSLLPTTEEVQEVLEGVSVALEEGSITQ